MIFILLSFCALASGYAIEPPDEVANKPVEVGIDFLTKYCVTVKSLGIEDDFVHLQIQRTKKKRGCRKFEEIEELNFSLNNSKDFNDVVVLEGILEALRKKLVIEKYFSKNYQARIGFKITDRDNSLSNDRFYVEVRSGD
jgi:hypothetical protein